MRGFKLLKRCIPSAVAAGSGLAVGRTLARESVTDQFRAISSDFAALRPHNDL